MTETEKMLAGKIYDPTVEEIMGPQLGFVEKLGDRSVIGAGSLVLRDVPPDVVVAGSPARVLNAGVEINGYRPVTLEELIENNRRFKDEHGVPRRE